MTLINKKDLIKDYILKDKERFLLAEDIFNHFKSITDDMLQVVVDQMIEHVCVNNPKKINLPYPVSYQMANEHGITLTITHEYSIQIEFRNYFKYQGLVIRAGKDGFDKNNLKHKNLRKLLKKNFSTSEGTEDWLISRIHNASDGLSMNIGDNYEDLFSVYQDQQHTNGSKIKKLCEDFDKIAGDMIVKIIEIIESVESES